MNFKNCFLKFTIFFIALLFIAQQRLSAQMGVQFADTLNKTLAELKQSYQMNGVASAVVFPDGSTWSSAEGHYGSEALHTDLLYDIGSNTKSMISTIILLLEEENKLSIGDTLYKFISPIQHVPYGVTLEQLMNHRSGIYSYTNHPDFLDEVNNNESKFWHVDSVLVNFLEPPIFAVGSSWSYSNTNYFLLGKVIEAVESKPLNTVLRDRLFNPNQMNDTYLDQYDTYTKTKLGTWLSPTNYDNTDFIAFMSCAWAAGAVIATPDNFATWAHQLFDGHILSDASMTKMRTGTRLNNRYTYGLGIFEENYKARKYLSHGGTTLQNSEMHYSLETKFSVVAVNINANYTAETANLQHDLIDLLESLIPTYVSIEERKLQFAIQAYPNPSNSQITIDLPLSILNQNISVKVYNTMGKLVLQQQPNSERFSIEKSDLGHGMFVVQVFNASLLLDSEKVIFN